MYTGIIDHLGEILKIELSPTGMHLWVKTQFKNLVEGESIAIDGFCVTLINPQEGQFECDLSPETLALTTAHYFQVGQKINLERSLRVGDTLGGHFVMGHVDTRATLAAIYPMDNFTQITIKGLNPEQMAYIVKKGSVSVNGISLTINEVTLDGFELMIIPHTLARTNLQFMKIDDPVNIEFDTFARIIVSQLKNLPALNTL